MFLPTGPAFQATVSVSMLIAGNFSAPASIVLDPVLAGFEDLKGPAHAFLLEHHAPGATLRRVLFDSGIRKDFENLSPVAQQLASMVNLTVEKDAPTQLVEGGIDLTSIEAIIWSHSHFDHIGDPSKFPNTTGLVVGPGTTAAFLPGFPTNPQSPLQDTDVANRTVTEIGFNTSTLTIAGFRTHDYFNDGSLYLLDIPGHITGHMGALARVTTNPDTFILLAGDSCHHPGQLRPAPNFTQHFPCPASILAERPISPQFFGGPDGADLRKRNQPLLTLHGDPPPSLYEFPEVARQSVGMLGEFDDEERVWVIIAHDSSLVPAGSSGGIVAPFPETLDAWKEKDWKKRTVWSFVERTSPAYRFRPTNASRVG